MSKSLLYYFFFLWSVSTLVSCDEESERKDIPRDGLVAFYPFNGNAYDESNVGIPANGIVLGAQLTTDRYNQVNRAYNFFGIDDASTPDSQRPKIDLGNSAKLQIRNAITIAAWVYFTDEQRLIGTVARKIDLESSSSEYGTGYLFGTLNSQNSFSVNRLLAVPDFGKIQSFKSNIWSFIAVTYDGKTVKLYKDNEPVYTTILSSAPTLPLTPFNPTNANLYLGTLLGQIDDVAIYNRALTGEEVRQLREQTITR